MNSMSKLQLNDNMLEGTLPAAWGANGSWPRLAALQLEDNMFTGQCSACWYSLFAQALT